MKIVNLCVFMSYRTSFLDWHEKGLASREISYYSSLAENNIRVTLITYGGNIDKKMYFKYYGNRHKSLEILPIFEDTYSQFIPGKFITLFYLFRFIINNHILLRDADFFKSKQMNGAFLPLICALLYRGKFIFRFGYDGLFFAKKARRNYLYRAFYFVFYKLALIFSHKIISTTKLIKSSFHHKFILQENWIDIDYFYVNPCKRILQFCNEPIFVTNGRLESQKNTKLLISIFCKLSYKLHIIGDGSEMYDLQEAAVTGNGNIIFHGRVPYYQVKKLYSDNCYYISTTSYEGNPKSILEAIASGMICLLPNVEGVANLIEPNVSGFLHDNSDDSIRSLIKFVLSLNSNKLLNISKTAAELARNRFSKNAALSKELILYKKLK